MENSGISLRALQMICRSELSTVYPEKEADQILFLLLEEWAEWKKIMAHARMEEELPAGLYQRLLQAIERLKSGEPVQYIIGMVSFAGARIRVTPAVLIPRPETEELVEFIARDQAQNIYKDFTLLDLCTGSGSVPVALSLRFSGLKATGTDISGEALAIARENALINSVKVDFLQTDLLDRNAWKDLYFYDVIVSNPPYIPETEKIMIRKNVLDHEPSLALFVPDHDPLIFYREIAFFAAAHLNRPGYLYLEIHEHFGQEVKKLLTAAGFEKVTVRKDFHGKDRFVTAEARFAMKDQSYWHADH